MSDQVPRSSKRLRRMASVFEQSISPGRSGQIAARALARARAGRRIGRRVPVLVTGISIFLLFVVALGVTAASSLPGDALYGVSRAYEEVGDWVGVVDPVEQRLHEVIALADRGDAQRAAVAAEEALVELLRTTDITFNIPAPASEGDAVASSSSSTVTAAADQIQSLRIAAELLLSSVKSNGSDLEAAAAGLADAVSDIGVQGEEPSSTTTSTTLPEEFSTTTTLPESTTTTIPDSSTTTVPGDGDGNGGDEDPGPIFLPPGS